jgi:hypothetical protein
MYQKFDIKKDPAFGPHIIFVCCMDLRKICIISPHNIKYTGFITETESDYWAVRAGSLIIILDKFSVQSLNKGKAIPLQI